MTTDADLMLALYNRLSQLTSAVVLMGEPSAVQSAPLVYLMGYQTDYRSSGGHEIIDMRPRIRLVVRWQDAPNAEAELLALQAVVHDLVTAAPLLDGACKVRWEQTLYGYLSVAGTRYRMAQLAPVLTTM
jgi:hypothetical protein